MAQPDARVAEVVALQAIYPGQVECSPEFESAAAALQAGECQDPSGAADLSACSCSGAVHVGEGAWSASLRFELPPGYPSEPARVHVTSPDVPRRRLDDLGALLQQSADEAASEAGGAGVECVYDLAERLRQGLGELGLAAAGAPGPGAGGAPRGGGAARPGERRVLLRLDHMRNRPMYLKTIRRWCKDLGLTGRVMFCNALILIALRGGRDAVGEYLVRARTEVVDVDSAGRKCRERLMDVLEDSTEAAGSGGGAASGGGGDGSGGGGGGRGGSLFAAAGGGGGAPPWPFEGFGEVEAGSYAEVARLLGCSEADVLAYAGLAPRAEG